VDFLITGAAELSARQTCEFILPLD